MDSSIINDKKVLFDPQMGLTSTTTLGQNESGSSGNEGILLIPQSTKTGTTPSYSGHYLGKSVSPLQRYSWHISTELSIFMPLKLSKNPVIMG